MPCPKPDPKRKSRSGSYLPDSQRGTVRVVVRCSPELAATVRETTRRHDCTLAEVLEAGVTLLRE